MTRKSRQAGAIDRTTPRNLENEQSLCEAIAKRVLVEILYEGDMRARLFQPSAVYFASTDNVNLAGIQISNPAKPGERNKPHVLTVEKIKSVHLTGKKFIPDPAFDPSNPMYMNDFICRV